MRVDVDSSRSNDGFIAITPHGSINAQTSSVLEEAVQPYLVPATKGMRVDLADVEYISSAGLQVLFGMKKYFAGTGGELLFCNLKPQIVKLFKIVNALPKESIFTSVEEADRYFFAIQNEEIRRQREKAGS